MKKNSLLLSCLLISGFQIAQNKSDSLKTGGIQEVILIKTNTISNKDAKPLGSVDDYLQKSTQVEMVRRGAYAWEPILNNMSTERTLITIDGMRIFGACTDKMDPITSYVEISNLSAAKIANGQQGSCHGTTIGGAINLERNKNNFGTENWKFNVNTGYESVNSQKIIGTNIQFKNTKFYNDANFMLRNANNYKAGNNMEIPYSQFHKFNISETIGVKLNDKNLAEASVIYDKATDVGYPALPMDISLAEAIIGSVKHKYQNKEGNLQQWETKLYYNNITHKMDDTKRASVPIHMDMPGYSTTYGYYSKAQWQKNNHQIWMNISGFLNKSLAEMTMYPNNPKEKIMFMLTWPDVQTINQGVYLEDNYSISDEQSIKISGALTFHQNKIKDKMGLESLQIFYPEMKNEKNRLLKSFASNYIFKKNNWEGGLGIGYGERAPSVSEGYGFYLFNSSEKYDYIGNPYLKNEKSYEGNAYLQWKKQDNLLLQWNVSYFHVQDFMVGEIISGLAPMTIGGLGVKKMKALEYANLLNTSVKSEVKINSMLHWKGQLTYNFGKDNLKENLPYISPVGYRTALAFEKNTFSTEIEVMGNTQKNNFNTRYGETKTMDFAIVNVHFGYKFQWQQNKIFLRAGVDNLLDTYYTTFSDWNKIPRPGRNFFVHLNYSF
jgi:iron complex outermembrane receptor protein